MAENENLTNWKKRNIFGFKFWNQKNGTEDELREGEKKTRERERREKKKKKKEEKEKKKKRKREKGRREREKSSACCVGSSCDRWVLSHDRVYELSPCIAMYIITKDRKTGSRM